jgi:serine O-acetyltransferase
MIKSYQDYLIYLEADRIALGRKRTIKALLFDDVWKFQRLMRELEYLTNCRNKSLKKLIVRYRFQRLGRMLGFSIPINVFGPGLSIAHRGTIVVNHGARVGANCRLHVCVNIGTEAGKSNGAPEIGDNCYIGPGAKLFGPIRLGDNLAIGANAVVNASFPEGNMTIGGVPAKKISDKGSDGLLIVGYKRP